MIEIIKKLHNGKCIGVCECGTEKEFTTSNILSGKSRSCGCIRLKRNIPNNIKRTFVLMRYRCNTTTSPDYARWGGAGIKVIYKSVEEFYKDVGDKPSKKHSIDRIDGNSDYKIGNCRWSTNIEQANNVSSNANIRHNGKIQSVAMWARELGINSSTIRERIKRGWTDADALSTPIDLKCHKRIGC